MALIEKGLNEAVDTTIVDAWADDPAFLDANPAGRVPTLVTDEGARLTEALLILTHLDAVGPEPAVLAGGPEALSAAGIAIGVFDAAVAVIIGRKSAPDFDTGLVGIKRFRTMREGLKRLDVRRRHEAVAKDGEAHLVHLSSSPFDAPRYRPARGYGGTTSTSPGACPCPPSTHATDAQAHRGSDPGHRSQPQA